MSKPDWKDAPEWAQWIACDNSGQWWWFSARPIALNHVWDVEDFNEQCECAHEDYRLTSRVDWRETLERRP